MRRRLYGSLNNRFAEGKNYTKRDIKAGDDLTMYYWSDREPYYITRVIDQKHIFVKPYSVCADHSKQVGMGHQDWMYFKTNKEMVDYLKEYYPDMERNVCEPYEEEWVYRYNNWYEVATWTKELVEKDNRVDWCMFNNKEQEKLREGKKVYRYSKLEPISFGVREKYHDWEF